MSTFSLPPLTEDTTQASQNSQPQVRLYVLVLGAGIALGAASFFTDYPWLLRLAHVVPLLALPRLLPFSRFEWVLLLIPVSLSFIMTLSGMMLGPLHAGPLYLLGHSVLAILAWRTADMVPYQFLRWTTMLAIITAAGIIGLVVIGGLAPSDVVANSKNNIVTLLAPILATSLVMARLLPQRRPSAAVGVAVLLGVVTLVIFTGRSGVIVGIGFLVIWLALAGLTRVWILLPAVVAVVVLASWSGSSSNEPQWLNANESGIERLERLRAETPRTEIWRSTTKDVMNPAYAFGYPEGYVERVTRYYDQPHNSYLGVLITYGLVGLGVVLAFIAAAGWHIYRRDVILFGLFSVLLVRALFDVALTMPLFASCLAFIWLASTGSVRFSPRRTRGRTSMRYHRSV